MSSRTKVRRRVLACARCRKRKLSCDGKVPSCTRCIDAGVPCNGFDSSTQREAPRSIAQYLEDHIARLEHPGNPHARTLARPGAAFPSPATSHDADGVSASSRSRYADDLVTASIEDLTAPFLGISQSVPILQCVVKGSQLPSKKKQAASTDLDVNHPKSIMNPEQSAGMLQDIFERQDLDQLSKIYLDHVITQYPIYHRDEVIAAFHSIYNPPAQPDNDYFRKQYIIHICIAVALSTSARTQQQRANSLASALVAHAMRWIPKVATNDFAGLQALLLLTQYIFLDPSMANIWLLTGLISQACIDLGLHQELPVNSCISPYERDMRRRIFWLAWEMETAVCAIFQKPTSLPTKFINVAFPAEVDDVAITEAGIDLTGRMSKFNFRRIWEFRHIEADIMDVLYHNRPIPAQCGSLEEWMAWIEMRVKGWYDEVVQAADANMDESFRMRWKEMKLYADIVLPYVRMIMYRPSKRIKHPTTENMVKAFLAAVHVTENYTKQANAETGRIKYVFHPCHHCFSSAVVFLQALSRCKAEISQYWSLDEVHAFMKIFSEFFITISERWPQATRCLEEYTRLLEPIKEKYDEYVMQKTSNMPLQSIPLGNGIVSELYNYSADPSVEENLNFYAVFNPVTQADMSEPIGTYSYLPQDWNAAFNFGVDAIPEL